MPDDTTTPKAVRALGTIRREALAGARSEIDAAVETLTRLRRDLDAPDDSAALERRLHSAIERLRAAAAEFSAFRDPRPRQQDDIARVRATRGEETAD